MADAAALLEAGGAALLVDPHDTDEIRDAIEEEVIPGVAMDHLSMGMTNDYEVAIEEGSTLVRVGRALFGERPKLA